jgi:cell wall-associated NlpC family hydrolase
MARAQDLAIYALGLIGVDYRYGGDTPEEGLDCSGLVRHVFQEVTGVTLPRTSKELARVGKAVQRADLKPGDLVFFNTRRSRSRTSGSTLATTASSTRRGPAARSRSPSSTTAIGASTSTAPAAWSACCPA